MSGNLHLIPEELRNLNQWVLWKREKTKEGKDTKIPYIAKLGELIKASDTNPTAWKSFDEAVKLYSRVGCDGVGFVFTKDDPFCGIDLDGAIDESGNIAEWAVAILREFNSYSEKSQSGCGIHIISKGRLPGAGLNRKIPGTDHKVEIYDRSRFFVFTGDIISDYPTIEERKEEGIKLYHTLNPPKAKPTKEKPIEKTYPKHNMTNDQILSIIRKSKQAEKFNQLWSGDLAGYPSASEADLALCGILAFYTQDCKQILNIIQDSSLWDEKWEREDYQNMTIGKALKGVTETYKPKRKELSKPKQYESYKSGSDLEAKEFPPITWIVEGYIPEGLTILAGKPKVGKSWLILNCGLTVAYGGKFLNSIDVQKGDVLYLDLDGNERRLKRRMIKIMAGKKFPENFIYCHSHERGSEGIKRIDSWLNEHPATKLVIIDTIGKFWQLATSEKVDQYAKTTGDLGDLQKLAYDHQIGIVCIHHLRKMLSDDPFDMVLGSIGMTGGVDTVAIMMKDRTRSDAVLIIDGKDMEETVESAIEFDRASGIWKLLGNAEDYRMSTERQEIVKLLSQAKEPMTPKQISDVLGKPYNNINKLVFNMVNEGVINKYSYGKYIMGNSGNSGNSNNSNNCGNSSQKKLF